MYGCINEDEFSLQAPRMIDGDECSTMAKAFEQAMAMMEDGVERISICRCKYYGPDGNGFWGEIMGDNQITIDARDVAWVKYEEEEA